MFQKIPEDVSNSFLFLNILGSPALQCHTPSGDSSDGPRQPPDMRRFKRGKVSESRALFISASSIISTPEELPWGIPYTVAHIVTPHVVIHDIFSSLTIRAVSFTLLLEPRSESCADGDSF